MKILIYAHHFPPAKGGMEYSNFEISKGLHSLGHAIEVLACRNHGISQFVSNVTFPVHLLPKWPFLKTYSLSDGARANWLFYPVYRSAVLEIIRETKPDVALVCDETANCFWGTWVKRIPIPYASYCSVPFVTVNGQMGQRGFLSRCKYWADELIRYQFKKSVLQSYSHASCVVAVSKSTKSELLKAAPYLNSKTYIVPRSIDDCFFDTPVQEVGASGLRNKLGIQSTDFVLLSVSSLSTQKGLDDVLRAMYLLDAPTRNMIKYIIVGTGEGESYLKRLTTRFGLQDHVVFAGVVPHLGLIPYYDLCDLFALPSRRGNEESFGRVFVEAAARRKPSIAVNEGGMTDVIINGYTGFLVTAGDTRAIRDALTKSLSHPKLLIEMGNHARQKAQLQNRSGRVALAVANRLKKAITLK